MFPDDPIIRVYDFDVEEEYMQSLGFHKRLYAVSGDEVPTVVHYTLGDARGDLREVRKVDATAKIVVYAPSVVEPKPRRRSKGKRR